MELKALQVAIAETYRFLHVAVEAQAEIKTNQEEFKNYQQAKKDFPKIGNKKQAACRRASMDLSRALTELRRFNK